MTETAARWVLEVHDGRRARALRLQAGAVLVGRARDCQVVIDAPGVAPRHARLSLEQSAASLQTLEPGAAVLLNGVAVRQATMLAGDELRIGSARLALRVDVERRPTASAADEPLTGGAAQTIAPNLGDGWAGALEDLHDWSRLGPPEQLGERLEDLRRAIDARTAALLLARPGAPLAVLAASGADADGMVLATGGLAEAREAPGALRQGALLLAWTPLQREQRLVLVLDAPARPWELGAARLAVRQLAHARLRGALPLVREPARGRLTFPAGILVGRAPAMQALYAQVAAIVDATLPVLVLGETGVGKEHVARLLHDSSARQERPFVTINCAAIPAELLESELFGIERGVATGVSERRGKFREAHGGTLFLDEIGELPLLLQAKLLRALEEKEVRPLGGRSSAVDLRVVAATNVELEAAVAAGRFRADLYHRLCGFQLRVPALRERRDDVPRLFSHFFTLAGGRTATALTTEALAALLRHAWPGNVRELRHEAARAAMRATPGESVGLQWLSPAVAEAVDAAAAPSSRDESSLDEQLERVERTLLRRALQESQGSPTAAARRLGISRGRLRRRLSALGVAACAGRKIVQERRQTRP